MTIKMAMPLFDEMDFSMPQITWFFDAIYRHHLIDKLLALSGINPSGE